MKPEQFSHPMPEETVPTIEQKQAKASLIAEEAKLLMSERGVLISQAINTAMKRHNADPLFDEALRSEIVDLITKEKERAVRDRLVARADAKQSTHWMEGRDNY